MKKKGTKEKNPVLTVTIIKIPLCIVVADGMLFLQWVLIYSGDIGSW